MLRLLRAESLDAVSREVGVELYRLEAWKERALAGLELGLKDQAGEPAVDGVQSLPPRRVYLKPHYLPADLPYWHAKRTGQL